MNKTGPDQQSILNSLASVRGPAPVHLWNPPYCGEIDIRIARDGRWFHNGSLIQRPRLVQLFSSVLRREEDGGYCLVTPIEKLGIQVEDCPFVAQLLESAGEAENRTLTFILNTGERVSAGPENSIKVTMAGAEPHPVLHVRRGLDALISRNVFYELVELADLDGDASGSVLRIWSGGVQFELGTV